MEKTYTWQKVTADNLPKVNEKIIGREADGTIWAVFYIRTKEVEANFEEPSEYIEDLIDGQSYIKEGFYEVLEDVPYYDTWFNRREIIEYLAEVEQPAPDELVKQKAAPIDIEANKMLMADKSNTPESAEGEWTDDDMYEAFKSGEVGAYNSNHIVWLTIYKNLTKK